MAQGVYDQDDLAAADHDTDDTDDTDHEQNPLGGHRPPQTHDPDTH